MVVNVEKKLRVNVLDDVKYSKKTARNGHMGLVVSLCAPFIAVLILLFMCARCIIG